MGPDKSTLDALRIHRPDPPRPGPPTLAIAVGLVILSACGGVAWWHGRTQPVTVRTVVAQKAAPDTDRTLLNASGYVTARRAATVSSKVTGKVVEVMVEEGMKVQAGQVLARLDTSNIAAAVRLAEAQAESARKAMAEIQANLDQASRDFSRTSQLATTKDASRAEVDKTETELKLQTARLERQKADVTVAEREVAIQALQLDDCSIRAPFAGVVTSKNAQPGEMISPLSVGGFTRTGICTLVDMSSLEIEVDVSENYINRIEPGQKVQATLDSYPNWKIPASVIAIIPTADRQKATVKVRVAFEKPDPRILPDMSVKVAFQGNDEGKQVTPGVTIPRAAIRHDDGRTILWVIHGGRVERRAVTVEHETGDNAVISAGLDGGERIVVDGPESLTEGLTVKENKR